MQKKLSKQNNSGFTLSEVLIAVAILIVLMGLAMIPITRHQRDLRQTELDAKAEIVYHAAQNKLSELLANGRISDCYAEDLQPLNNTPLDAAERKTSLYYVTSAAKTGEGSAAAAILPEDQVDQIGRALRAIMAAASARERRLSPSKVPESSVPVRMPAL